MVHKGDVFDDNSKFQISGDICMIFSLFLHKSMLFLLIRTTLAEDIYLANPLN